MDERYISVVFEACDHPVQAFAPSRSALNRIGRGFERCGGSLRDCIERGNDESSRGVTPEAEKDRRPQRFGWLIA
jgi:hypothetical protein